jgi:hypothetical protein
MRDLAPALVAERARVLLLTKDVSA